MFSQLLLIIFSVQHIPFAAAGGDAAGERLNLLAHDVVETVFSAEKLAQKALSLGERSRLVGKVREVVLPHPIDDQKREIRYPALGQPRHRSICLTMSLSELERVMVRSSSRLEFPSASGALEQSRRLTERSLFFPRSSRSEEHTSDLQ